MAEPSRGGVSRELLTWLDKAALLIVFVLLVCVTGLYLLGIANHALLVHLHNRSTVCPAPPQK